MLLLANRYKMYRVEALTTHVVKYWQDVMDAGLLNARLFDTVKPNLKDIEEMLAIPNNICYIMYDEVDKFICADTMINNVTGLAAQVHFSMHPRAIKERKAVSIARAGCEQHFNTRIIKTGECIETLFGITPVDNFLAVRFIQRVGFRPVTTLRKVCYLADHKAHADGLLTTLTVEDLYGR